MKKLINPPTPKVLINSIRQIGYSFESAIADIIDNSIVACAKSINIFLPINKLEESYIAFLDDGLGMDKVGIINALKVGSNFEGERDADDLGRFGLGLKSASFSQCRKLTIVSKKDNKLQAFGWDISEIVNSNEWNLFEFSNQEIASIQQIEKLKEKLQGTLVVWQDFDLIRDRLDDNIDLQRQLSDLIEKARKHIALVFHRYLNKKIVISINNLPIKGLDPFLENHNKTEKGKADNITIATKDGKEHTIKIQAYTMPHYYDLLDSDNELLGGADVMRDMQGFYVYRNERLIVYGTWFKIRVRSELAKYAKIKVDIPNTLDDIWEIDIKKQKAIIPQKLMAHFRKTIENIRVRSEKKIRHKQIVDGKDDKKIWNKKIGRNDKTSYYINVDSNFVKEYLYNNFDELEHSKIRRLLEIVGATIPFDDIYNAVCNQSVELTLDKEREVMIIDEGVKMARQVASIKQITNEQAIEKIASIEPFNNDEIITNIRRQMGI